MRTPYKEWYFNSSNGLQSALFNAVEDTLGEVVRYCRVPTISKTSMCSVVQKNAVVDTIVKSALSNLGFIVPIVETVGNMVKRAADEYACRTCERH